MESIYSVLSPPPSHPVLESQRKFEADPSPLKIPLASGAYRTAEGKPYLFKTVATAEQRLLERPSRNKEYLFQEGNPEYIRLANEVVFGRNSIALSEQRIVGIQTPGATGALNLIAHLLAHDLGFTDFYLPTPTWFVHSRIFPLAGLRTHSYPYVDPGTTEVNFAGMLRTLEAASGKAAVLIQGCCQNPTGRDLTPAQWQEVLDVARRKQLLVVLDYAYAGFGDGLEEDLAAVRLFDQSGLEFVVAHTFSKSMGLYGERIGSLHIVTSSPEYVPRVMGNIEQFILVGYLTPSIHGGDIAIAILGDPALKAAWLEELESLRSRVANMRQKLYEAMQTLGTPGNWESIVQTKGMFWFNGLSKAQNEYIIDEWHCYLVNTGRVTVAGLSDHNVEHFAKAIDSAVRNIPS